MVFQTFFSIDFTIIGNSRVTRLLTSITYIVYHQSPSRISRLGYCVSTWGVKIHKLFWTGHPFLPDLAANFQGSTPCNCSSPQEMEGYIFFPSCSSYWKTVDVFWTLAILAFLDTIWLDKISHSDRIGHLI